MFRSQMVNRNSFEITVRVACRVGHRELIFCCRCYVCNFLLLPVAIVLTFSTGVITLAYS